MTAAFSRTWSRARGYGCLLLLCFFTLSPASGQPPGPTGEPPWTPPADAAQSITGERRALLEDESAAIARERETQQRLADEFRERQSQLSFDQVTKESLESLERELETAKLRREDIQIALENSQRRVQSLEREIQALESRIQLLRNPAQAGEIQRNRAAILAQAETDLAVARESLSLERLQLDNHRGWQALIEERLQFLDQFIQQRTSLYNQRLENERRQAQDQLAGQLRDRQRQLFRKVLRLQETLVASEGMPTHLRQLLTTQLRDAQERSSLLHLEIRLAALEDDLRGPEALMAQTEVDFRQLEQIRPQLQSLQQELTQVDDLLSRKIELLRGDLRQLEEQEALEWAAIQSNLEQEEILEALVADLEARQRTVQVLAQRGQDLADALETRYTELLNRRLFDRQSLPRNAEEWSTLLTALANSPETLLYQVRLSVESLGGAAAAASPLTWMLLVALILGLLVGIAVLWGNLRHALGLLRERCRRERRFTDYIVLSFGVLLHRNLPVLGLAGVFGLILWLLPVRQPGLGILITVVAITVITKLMVDLAGLLLVSPDLPLASRPALYRDVWLSLLLFGLAAAMVILARLSSLAQPVVMIYDRLFMLLLLLLLLPLWKIRRLVIDVLASRYAERPWFVSLRVLSLAFPLAVLGPALLGLSGYLLLAWSLNWHLMVLVLVIVCWLVVRGLLNDFTAYLKNIVMIHTRYGLLWTQDVINPARRLVGVVLLLGFVVLLLHLFQWDPDSPLLGRVWVVSEWTLMTVGGTAITVRAVVLSLVLAWAVLGIARWVRNVTYRWVFSAVMDLGVRNSLSVFTQYAVVLLGFLVGLHTLGLNLSSLALFAGAVGVGIGFGLQTVANNFISGLLLLIERPLRSGDTVQIGGNLGTIERIGIRSLTMKTWDNTDVIIPNADVISGAFTNWTHSDNVIRTLFFLPIPVDSDPHLALSLARQVVDSKAGILRTPESVVSLWEMGGSAITLRVQYYTDFFQSDIIKVRSEVMLGIYDQLQAAGIPIQINEQGLRIRPDSAPLALSREPLSNPVPLDKDRPNVG